MHPALAAAQQPHAKRGQACLLHAHRPGILALRYCSMHLAQYRCRHAMEIRAFLILPAGTAPGESTISLGCNQGLMVGATADVYACRMWL
jgi:hypothetical protein